MALKNPKNGERARGAISPRSVREVQMQGFILVNFAEEENEAASTT